MFRGSVFVNETTCSTLCQVDVCDKGSDGKGSFPVFALLFKASILGFASYTAFQTRVMGYHFIAEYRYLAFALGAVIAASVAALPLALSDSSPSLEAVVVVVATACGLSFALAAMFIPRFLVPPELSVLQYPPTSNWSPSRTYACFLSHCKVPTFCFECIPSTRAPPCAVCVMCVER